ncbi:hypothetical protein D3C71_2100520 [compost metagenome]
MIQGPHLIIHSEAVIRDRKIILRLLWQFLNGANHIVAPIAYAATDKFGRTLDFRTTIVRHPLLDDVERLPLQV